MEGRASLLDRLAAADEDGLRELWVSEIAPHAPALRLDHARELRTLLRHVNSVLAGDARDDVLPVLMQLVQALRPRPSGVTLNIEGGTAETDAFARTLGAEVPRAPKVLPFAGKREPTVGGSLEPHPELGMTAPTSPKQRSAPPLPFGAAPTPATLTLDAYAAVQAQLAAYPDSRDHVLRSFQGGLSEATLAAADKHWRAQIDADAALRRHYDALSVHYQAHYRKP